MKSKLTLAFLFLLCTTAFSQESCLTDAWTAYNNKDWKAAIQNANFCVVQFGPRATNIQEELESKEYVFPCAFTVPKSCDAQAKNEIFSHGLLNDVATCYWIIGMSNRFLGNTSEAKIAFKKSSELSFGLCYDPSKDSFWSPSEESALQIKALN